MVGAWLHLREAVVKTAPLAPATAFTPPPAEHPRPPIPLATWEPAREPSFLAWLDYAGDTALTSWVRHRFGRVGGTRLGGLVYEPPQPHVVYAIRGAAEPPAFYVGITRADRVDQRMAEHRRATRRLTRDHDGPDLRAYEMDAWEAYEMAHGFDRIEHTIPVPDKVTALLVKALQTCLIAGAGYKVFGHWLGDLCPAKAWLERPAPWDRNTVRPR
jgi:hypothetical protein